jgi:hypothetical protein
MTINITTINFDNAHGHLAYGLYDGAFALVIHLEDGRIIELSGVDKESRFRLGKAVDDETRD